MTNPKLKVLTFRPSEEGLNSIKEHSRFIDQETVNMAYHLSIVEHRLETNGIKPHLFIQIVKHFLSAISSQYPNKFHFTIAEKVLIKSQVDYNDDAVTLLAKSLCDELRKLEKRLNLPEIFTKHIKLCESKVDQNTEHTHLVFIECPDSLEEFESFFFDNTGLSIWDSKYLKLLRSLGNEGKKRAEEFKNALKGRKVRKSLWFIKSKPEENIWFYESSALFFLGCALWEDVVKRYWNFKEKQVPALTKGVNEPIRQILSPKNEISEHGGETQVFHQGALVGGVAIPTVHPAFINVVSNGVYKLNSVTGHRLIRYLVGGAFERAVNGHADPRVLKLDRGATDIADQLELVGHHHTTNIKEIIHAMAYFEFRDPVMAGNLIQLSKYKSPLTGRVDEGYLVTIGTPLLPYKTFENRERDLLIPLLKDPPLVGSNRSHAGQYLLQMSIMALLSKESIELFTNGAIEITEALWQEYMVSCGLSSELLPKVRDRWTRDGDDGAMFLEKVDDNFYTLGPAHAKEREFLMRQGELRIAQSNRGKASTIKQKRAKEKTRSKQNEK